MALAGSKRRSTRQAVSRSKKRSIYAEPDTDDDFDFEDGGEEEYAPEPQPEPQAAPRRLQKHAARTRHHTRSKSSKVKAGAQPKLKGVGRRRKWNTIGEAPKKAFKGPSDGRVPDWTSLPIDILREVFFYASQPLHEQTRTSAGNVDWLVKTARVCRAFATPALEVYYRSPSLLTNMHPHHLLELLQMPKEKRYMDYNVKTKSLYIDVRKLAYSAHNKGLFDLSYLVAGLPQLQYMEILHPIDEPPFRPVRIQNWQYPANLFQAFEQRGTRLKSWRWNRDMMPTPDHRPIYEVIAQTHTSKPFESVESLTICGFDWNDSAEPASSDDLPEGVILDTAPGLATSICLLPNLKDLTFISCEVVVNKFLERLPKDLERLEITNCLELTSGMLQRFLVSGGSQLRELVLNHNPALNLAFLGGLKMLCPKLELLKTDLRYYSEKLNSNDAEPLYDELLAADEIPTWPSTLRHLELIHLQRWAAEAAQNTFRSLVESAAELPDLRFLVLQAHINIPWRDRAEFRDQWIERLQRVYARRSEPPNPYLGSLRQFKLWKQAQAEGWDLKDGGRGHVDDDSDDDFTIGRRISFVQISPAKRHDGDTDVYSDSSPEKKISDPEPVRRRSTRVAQAASQASASASPPANDSDDSATEGDDDADDWRKQPEKYIQGLCTVVDIRIDNQRPRENQFTEGDFLDSEASGDEDWKEGNEDGEEEEEGYAW